MAVYLEVGSRRPTDVTTCSDIDMMSTNADGRFVQGWHALYRPLEVLLEERVGRTITRLVIARKQTSVRAT